MKAVVLSIVMLAGSAAMGADICYESGGDVYCENGYDGTYTQWKVGRGYYDSTNYIVACAWDFLEGEWIQIGEEEYDSQGSLYVLGESVAENITIVNTASPGEACDEDSNIDVMRLLPAWFSGGQDVIEVRGYGDDDTITGSYRDEQIYGGDDDDYIEGLGGADYINGEAGADEIYGGIGVDTVRGGDGDDYIAGNTGGDYLYGDDDNDTIRGGLGDDYIEGNADRDTLYGDDGYDEIHGGTEIDYLYGGDDDDDLYGDDHYDYCYGEGGTSDVCWASCDYEHSSCEA